jgi:uncharacterized protein
VAGKFRSYLAILGLGGLVIAQNQGCIEGAGADAATGAAESARIQEVLAGLGPRVVLPTLSRFITEMEALQIAVIQLCEELEAGGAGKAERAEAQERWVAAMTVWQELELMQFGPAASSLGSVAGRDFRDEIYSWPTVNPCRVDQRTVDGTWESDDFMQQNLVNAYGLDALEHLLFAGVESTCPSQVAPVSDGSWAALGEQGIEINRADYAAVISAEVLGAALALHGVWSESGENFSAQMSGVEGSPYSGPEEALGEVFDSLFYLDTLTKDRKLAYPMGLGECSSALCLEDLEGLASASSLASLSGNLRGFRLVMTGGDGAGLDDLLVDLGHGDLAEQVLADVDATLSLAAAIEAPLDVALVEQPAAVDELYDALCLVTDALKLDLATVLRLQVPSEAAGDND